MLLAAAGIFVEFLLRSVMYAAGVLEHACSVKPAGKAEITNIQFKATERIAGSMTYLLVVISMGNVACANATK